MSKGSFSAEWVEECEKKFAEFDLNGDGKLDLEELKGVVKALNPNMKSILVNNVAGMKMQQGDKNRDGMIDVDEFYQLYKDMREENGETVAAGGATPRDGEPKRGFVAKGGSVSDTIKKVADNDPETVTVQLVGSASYQMKSDEYTKQLAEALKGNTVVKEVILNDLAISDVGASSLAEAIEVNSTIEVLNLETNNLKNDGGTALAKALAKNNSIIELNLMKQKATWGDACLDEFVKLFETNITLRHINWRLESRKSFTINKKIVRNTDIEKRKKEGKGFQDLLPDNLKDPSQAEETTEAS